jgi:hypothetical protein
MPEIDALSKRYPSNSNSGDLSCADGGPSARITDCARMKSHPRAIGDHV